MQVTVFDKVSFEITKREYMDNGFLCVPGRVARTGIQEYLAGELGLDGNPLRIVKVFRPEEEVFDQASLDSYSGADITIEHPSGFVDSKTYSNISKGTTLNAVRDGDFVQAKLIIKSSDAIKAVESGKVQLSAGYGAVYDKAPVGAAYEYIQRNIRINHVALVDRARAGNQARLFDANHTKTEIKTMPKLVVLDSGRSVEIEDAATATLISDAFERQAQKVKDAEKLAKDSGATADKANATIDAQAEKIKNLESKLKEASDSETIKKQIAELAQVQDSAKRIAGDEFSCDSVDSLAIKRAALKEARKSIDWDAKSDHYVSAAFEFADEDMKEKEGEEDETSKKTKGQREKLAKDAATVKKTVDYRAKKAYIQENTWRVTDGQLSASELNAKAEEIYGGNK